MYVECIYTTRQANEHFKSESSLVCYLVRLILYTCNVQSISFLFDSKLFFIAIILDDDEKSLMC